MTTKINLLPVALFLSTALAAQNGTAVFDITFQSTWSKATHPTNFPANPHFSPLIGATHNAATSFWMPGGIATNGIEVMAETGGTAPLAGEINSAINKGGAKSMVRGGGLGSPGTITLRFIADASHPRLTIVTMIAPSPDWFAGLSGVDLMKNGRWIEQVAHAATAWDAGTDSGITYTSPDKNTSPKEKIAVVSTSVGPFKGYSTRIGTWTIKRVASTIVYGCGVNPTGSMSVMKGQPLLGQSIVLGVNDPGRSMPVGSTAFLLLSATATPNFPCGVKIPGFGMSRPGANGEFLLGSILLTLPGAKWSGSAVPFMLDVPNDPNLVGVTANVQGGLVSATRLGMADAVEIRIGK